MVGRCAFFPPVAAADARFKLRSRPHAGSISLGAYDAVPNTIWPGKCGKRGSWSHIISMIMLSAKSNQQRSLIFFLGFSVLA